MKRPRWAPPVHNSSVIACLGFWVNPGYYVHFFIQSSSAVKSTLLMLNRRVVFKSLFCFHEIPIHAQSKSSTPLFVSHTERTWIINVLSCIVFHGCWLFNVPFTYFSVLDTENCHPAWSQIPALKMIHNKCKKFFTYGWLMAATGRFTWDCFNTANLKSSLILDTIFPSCNWLQATSECFFHLIPTQFKTHTSEGWKRSVN